MQYCTVNKNNVPSFNGFRKIFCNHQDIQNNYAGEYTISVNDELMQTTLPVVYEFTCEGQRFTVTQSIDIGDHSPQTYVGYQLTDFTADMRSYATKATVSTTINNSTVSNFTTLSFIVTVTNQSGYLKLETITIGGTPLMGIADYIYPVGSIYMSVNSTSPATLFGGIWERIEGRFLLSATVNSTAYLPGTTGGEAEHTLTTLEMPNHTHGQQIEVAGYEGWSTRTASYMQYAGYANPAERPSVVTSTSYSTLDNGGSQSHNNMPPYLAVHMWKRTA